MEERDGMYHRRAKQEEMLDDLWLQGYVQFNFFFENGIFCAAQFKIIFFDCECLLSGKGWKFR